MHHNVIIKDGNTTKVVKKVLVDGVQFVDDAPIEGSSNLASSNGVAKAIGDTKESVDEDVQDLQNQIDDIAEKAGSGYIPKGEATVATLNGLSGQENGWLYTMTDAGTLTDGSLAVVAGDTVAWDATNEVWYKAMNYAPRQYGTNEVHNLPTTITAFRTGDVIPVDGPSGTAKMSKDSLLGLTAENTIEKFPDVLGLYSIGSSVLGYIGMQGGDIKIITSSGNKWRHFVCNVDVGKEYVVRTILGSGTTYIAEGDTSTQTTGFTSLVQNTIDPTNLKDYVVTPTKPYLFITYRVPDDLGDPWTQNDYKCFVVNAKNYASESAEYTNTIILSQDSSSPININQNTIIYGNGYHVNLGTELSLEFTGDIGEALYTASVDGDVYKCFVTQELPLSVSGDRPYYQVTLWAIDDNDVSNSIILTPKLTTTEVNNTTNSFTYDGTNFVVNVPNHSNFTRFVLNQDGNYGYCLLCNGYKVRCYDVVFEFASFECAHVEGSRYCEFVNCEFAYPKAYNSLQTKDVQNVVLRNCTAHHANNDGFSVGYSGVILMEDCTGSYNQDDGVSNHGNRGETRFVIRGGEYHHNHKGGISSPVYGSVGDIHEVVLHDNHYGVYATNPTDGRTRYYKQTNKISGCHIYDNTVGIYASEYKLITWSNVLNNTTDYEEVNGGVIVR